jgi:ferredoxin
MPYRITSYCTYCGECEGVCPRGAILREENQFQVDNDLCDECAGDPKCVTVCPEDCIKKVSLEELVED